jgi:hypothetical protein
MHDQNYTITGFRRLPRKSNLIAAPQKRKEKEEGKIMNSGEQYRKVMKVLYTTPARKYAVL